METLKGNCGNSTQWSYSDGVLTISGTGPMDKYRMPNRCPWRELREEIEEVVVEEGVTSVGQCAFKSCSKLEKVTLPTTLQSIGSNAFAECCNLVDIVIPEGVSIIDIRAFDHCKSLQSVLFPTSLEIIDDQAFWGCSMSSIEIPCGVKRIGYSAFAYCEQLESVTLPMGLETINDSAFSGCSNLSQIALPHTVSEVGKDAFPEGCNVTESKDADDNHTNDSEESEKDDERIKQLEVALAKAEAEKAKAESEARKMEAAAKKAAAEAEKAKLEAAEKNEKESSMLDKRTIICIFMVLVFFGLMLWLIFTYFIYFLALIVASIGISIVLRIDDMRWKVAAGIITLCLVIFIWKEGTNNSDNSEAAGHWEEVWDEDVEETDW